MYYYIIINCLVRDFSYADFEQNAGPSVTNNRFINLGENLVRLAFDYVSLNMVQLENRTQPNTELEAMAASENIPQCQDCASPLGHSFSKMFCFHQRNDRFSRVPVLFL